MGRWWAAVGRWCDSVGKTIDVVYVVMAGSMVRMVTYDRGEAEVEVARSAMRYAECWQVGVGVIERFSGGRWHTCDGGGACG